MCPPAQEDLGPYHYFQMSMIVAQREKKHEGIPGGSHLILSSSLFTCHSNFPSVVSDEGVEFVSAGGTGQFEHPLARLGGQPEMFKWGRICAL